MRTPNDREKTRLRSRTLPGKYMLSRWHSVEATDAQRLVEEEALATQRLLVVRCLYRAGCDFAPHVHPQEQLTIVEEGELEFAIDDEQLRVGTGQMISIFPGVAHATRVLGEQPARALTIFQAPSGSAGSAQGPRRA